jgi:hypothetical protein
MGQVLINGKAFSAADITVTIAGIDIASVATLNIVEAADKQNNYGFATQPTSRGRGQTEYTCSVEMAYKDVQKLRNLVPTRRLLDLQFFNVLAVLDNGETVARVRARNAEFLEDGIEVAGGDPEVKREYPLIIAGVDYL